MNLFWCLAVTVFSYAHNVVPVVTGKKSNIAETNQENEDAREYKRITENVNQLKHLETKKSSRNYDHTFIQELQANINKYRNAYYSWNIRHFKQNDLSKRFWGGGGPGPIPLRMKIEDSGLSLDLSKRFVGPQPLRMKIDDSAISSDLSKRVWGGGRSRPTPLRMKIEHRGLSSDLSKRFYGPQPLRMKIDDSALSSDVSKRFWRGRRPGPIPLRMKIEDSGLSSDFSKRFYGPQPLRMKIEDSGLSSDLSKRFYGPQPLRMKIDDSALSTDLSKRVWGGSRRPRPSPRPRPSQAPFKISDIQSQEEEIYSWFNFAESLIKKVKTTDRIFFKEWANFIPLFSNHTLKVFLNLYPKLSIQDSIDTIGFSDAFVKLFWPFRFDVGYMNQKLSLLGIAGKTVNSNQKIEFFRFLEEIQTIRIPVEENKIVYSFNNDELVEGMNRSGLLENSKEFVDQKRHLFSVDEIKDITKNVDAALELINSTSPMLYKSMLQLVGCIAFYKSEQPGHLGGTVSSALGVIWLDPSVDIVWSIPFYAEQIVHEYIHTSLFYAELVHGTYTDHTRLPDVKVVSSIRRQLRDYDKSFHAAYVATGLVTFHSKAGFLKRAAQLAKPLPSSIADLVTVNENSQILNLSGKAMLQSMVDFLTVIRML